MASGQIIKRKEVPFSQVSNQALRDKTLSLKAKGLYALIQSYITIPDFVLYKQTLINMSIEGKDSFEGAWKELKKRGYLVQIKHKNAEGKFFYEYELLDFIDEKEGIKEPPPKKPHMEKPHMEKPQGGLMGGYNNKDFNKTDLNNKYKNKKQKQNPSASVPKTPQNTNEDIRATEVSKGLSTLKSLGYNTFNNKLVLDISNQKSVSDIKNFVNRVINGELFYPKKQKA